MNNLEKQTKRAIFECKHFIECAEKLNFENWKEDYNFFDAGIQVLIENLQKVDKKILEEMKNLMKEN